MGPVLVAGAGRDFESHSEALCGQSLRIDSCWRRRRWWWSRFWPGAAGQTRARPRLFALVAPNNGGAYVTGAPLAGAARRRGRPNSFWLALRRRSARSAGRNLRDSRAGRHCVRAQFPLRIWPRAGLSSPMIEVTSCRCFVVSLARQIARLASKVGARAPGIIFHKYQSRRLGGARASRLAGGGPI